MNITNPLVMPVSQFPLSFDEAMRMRDAFDISFSISEHTTPNISVQLIDFYGRMGDIIYGYVDVRIPLDTWSADVMNWQLARYLATTHFANHDLFTLHVDTLLTPHDLSIGSLEKFITGRIQQLGLPGGVAILCEKQKVRLASFIPEARWDAEVRIYDTFCKITATTMTMLAKHAENPERCMHIKADYFSDCDQWFKWGSDLQRWIDNAEIKE